MERFIRFDGNPATAIDHAWNPNATKLILPVSDEGPFGGSPALNADDYKSIDEAYDACLQAGITPVLLLVLLLMVQIPIPTKIQAFATT